MLLGLHWPRMSRAGALMSMACGMAMATYYIFINHPWVQTRLGLSTELTAWWGLQAHSAAVFGVPIGLLAGVLGSLLWPRGPARSKTL